MKIKRRLSLLGFNLVLIAIITLSWAPITPVNENNSYVIDDESSKKSTELNPLALLEVQASALYESIDLEEAGLSFDVFEKAFIGFLNLKNSHKISQESSVISIADFDLSSKKKRLWIIDLETESLLLNTWVSHGRGSGGEMATQFSNTTNSHQSSLGFYVTGEVYRGKHGRSLRLDGMDRGFNSNARSRAIVLHGASYVSSQAIKNLNRLGLSHGCPAVPVELTNTIINLIKDKSVLYIHASAPEYRSAYLNPENAGKRLLASVAMVTDSSSHVGI